MDSTASPRIIVGTKLVTDDETSTKIHSEDDLGSNHK